MITRALHTLLEKHAWPRALTPWEMKFLTEQTLPYEAPGLWSQVEASGGTGVSTVSFGRDEFKPHKTLSFHDWTQIAVDVSGGIRPYRYTIRLESAGGREIGSGRGRDDLVNRFEWEKFPVPCAGLAVGSVIVFEVTDAIGTRLTQRLRVTSADSWVVEKPDVTPAKADAVSTAKVDASQAGGLLLAGDRVDFRECMGEYRIRPYVRVAAQLLAMPEAERIAQLRAWANYRDKGGPFHNMTLNEHLLYLYRLLFEKKEKGDGTDDWIFGPFWIGGPGFVGMSRRPLTEEGCAAYPDSPFLFVGDVPFFVVRGYARDGVPDAGKYLEFFLKDAQWSHRHYDQVTPAVIAQALHTLLEKHVWPRTLTTEERQFLTDQTSPDAARLWPEVLGTSGNARRSMMYRKDGFYVGDTQSLDKLDRLAVIVSGGVLPYRYEIRLETDGRAAVVGSGQGGIDLLEWPGWPWAEVKFQMPWKNMQAGQVIALEVTDAKGAKLVQRLRVTGPKSVAIEYPVFTPRQAE